MLNPLEADVIALRQRITDLEAQLVAARTTEVNRTTEANYRLLAENVADVIWVLDVASGRFIYVSPSVERLRGYTAVEVLTQSMAEVVTPDSLALISRGLPDRIAAFRAGDPDAVMQTHEIEQVCKGGRTDWTEVRTTLLWSETGELHVLGVSRDISDRRVVEDALRRSEENLNRAQALAHTGSWVFDIPANRLEWSQETYRMFGLPQGEMLTPEDFLACVHSDDRDEVLAAWDSVLEGARYAIDHRIVVGGEVRWVHEEAEIQYDAQGAPVLVIGAARDITERKLAENALLTSEARYRVIFDGAVEGIVAYNLAAHHFEYVNPAMCALFGYDRTTFQRLDIPDLHPVEVHAHVVAEFVALTRGEK